MKQRQCNSPFIIVSLLLSVLFCILSSCTFTEKTIGESGGKAHISVSLSTDSFKTIVPAGITESDIIYISLKAEQNDEEIAFWSWAEDTENGLSAFEQMYNYTDTYINEGTYDFTLTLSVNTEIYGWREAQRGVLKNKTIVSGENALVFNTQYIEDAYGSVSLTLTWEESQRISEISVAFFTDDSDGETGTGYNEWLSKDESGYFATFRNDWLTTGTYFVRFDIYGKASDDSESIKLNTIEDVIWVASGCTTSATISLTNINTPYKITYELNGGQWASYFSPTEQRNACKIVTLPTADVVIRDGYIFEGWFMSDDNGESFTGDAVTRIGCGTSGDITLWAKWSKVSAPCTMTIKTGEYSEIPVSTTLNGTQVQFTVETGYASYLWLIDGESVDSFSGAVLDESNMTLTLETSSLPPGQYDVILETVDSDGKRYSYWSQIEKGA